MMEAMQAGCLRSQKDMYLEYPRERGHPGRKVEAMQAGCLRSRKRICILSIPGSAAILAA